MVAFFVYIIKEIDCCLKIKIMKAFGEISNADVIVQDGLWVRPLFFSFWIKGKGPNINSLIFALR